MKTLISSLILIILFSSNTVSFSQINHVINGSFEDTFKCPPASIPGTFATSCVGWSAVYFNSTPDYYHPCSNVQYSSAPNNWLGYQQAAEGGAYVGIVVYNIYNRREYIESSIVPLETGDLYEVSLSVSLPEYFILGTDGLGVLFYKQGVNTNNNLQPINATPQINYWQYGPITDTQNWVRLVDTFTADSAYSNIMIGSFLQNSQTTVDTLNYPGGYESYYYIDSVVVRHIEDLYINYSNTTACAKDTIVIPYTVLNKPVFTSNNVFTLQLSDKSGSFSNATTLGTKTGNISDSFQVSLPATLSEGSGYRLRVVTSNNADTFLWDSTLAIGNLDSANIQVSSNSPLCVGDTLRLTAINNANSINYSWTGPSSFTATTQSPELANVAISNSGNYYSVTDVYGCKQYDTLSVTVSNMPAQPTISYNNPICTGDTLNLNASTVAGATYIWTGPNNFSSNSQQPVINNVSLNDTGMYSVKTSYSGCNSPASSVRVSINASPFVVIYPTPSGDICPGDTVAFTALPNNSGGIPQYRWLINGQTVATNTLVYTAISLNNNDIIHCEMTEYTKCATPFTDPSNDIQITVQPWLTPLVSITSDKTGPIKPYQYITFTATATNAGNPPLYQWKRNGADVLGANSYQWSANTLNDNDSISVEIVSTYKCPQPKAAKSNGIVVRILTSAGDIDGLEELMLYPNPNNGSFTVAGEKQNQDQIRLEILNVQGQVVYTDAVAGSVSAFSKQINTNYLPAGTYLFKLSSDSGSKTLLFVIQ